MSTATLSAQSEADALEDLHRLGCTDGLPVVIPTADRVARMVLASGLDPEGRIGTMGPLLGVATVEKVATAAVMAGCLPDYMPVVIAAVKAVCDPVFDLTEMQATTHCTAPFVIVNGPIRHGCDMSSGSGALGPGNRANASIGRALRLAMINIGGGRAGSSDMALLGHPGKFTYCLAENEEGSPFTPLHVSRGFDISDSVVTVIGADSPHSVVHVSDADDPGAPDRLLRSLGTTFASLGTNNAWITGGQAVVILNPDHANELAAAGYDRDKIAEAICGYAVNTIGDLAKHNPTRPGKDDDDVIAAFKSPDDILVLMAGGGGLYSAVMPTWCGGPHQNQAVSVAIELDQMCEVPTNLSA